MSKWRKFNRPMKLPKDRELYLCKQDPKRVDEDFVYMVLWYDGNAGMFRGWKDGEENERDIEGFYSNVLEWRKLPKNKKKGGKLEKED